MLQKFSAAWSDGSVQAPLCKPDKTFRLLRMLSKVWSKIYKIIKETDYTEFKI